MKSTIIVKHQAQLIPVDHLLKVLHEAAPNCLGIAGFRSKEEDSLLLNHFPALQDIGKDMGEIASEIGKLLEDFKDSLLILNFSDTPGAVTATENGWDTPHMLPLPLLTDPETSAVHLVLAATGDFSRWDQKDSVKPTFNIAVEDDLMPRLGELFGDAGNDLQKLMAKIRGSQTFQKDIKKLSAGDGVFSFLASDGDLLTVNTDGVQTTSFDWGWSTHKAPTAPAQEAAKPRSRLSLPSFLGKKSEKAPTPAPVDVPKADPAIMPKPSETETAPVPTVTEQMVKCPSHITSKQEVKRWYATNAGYVPQNFKQKPTVKVMLPIKSLQDLGKAAAIAGNAASEIARPIASTEPLKPKDTAPHMVKPEMAKPVVKRVPGMIPAEMRDKMLKDGVVLKMVDRSSQIISTIEAIKAEETKYPSLSEQMPKLGLEFLLAATPADYDHLILEYPDAVVSALMGYRSLHLKLKEMEKANQLAEAAAKQAPAAKSKLTLGRIAA